MSPHETTVITQSTQDVASFQHANHYPSLHADRTDPIDPAPAVFQPATTTRTRLNITSRTSSSSSSSTVSTSTSPGSFAIARKYKPNTKKGSLQLPTIPPSYRDVFSMRFTSNARPSLTPLGHRLLHLSESKLNQLEPALGGRDTATLLWKGVLVREAVKSAWRSVDEGVQAEMNDWSHKAAMGLDVIGEDDEEEEELEEQEGRWFEELVSSFGEDDFGEGQGAYAHEWADANVASAFDDVEYDEADMEAYTLPSSPSPTLATIAIPALPVSPAPDYDFLPASEVTSTEVEILEVSDEDEDEDIYESDSDSEIDYHYGTRSAHLVFPEPHPLQPIIIPLSVPRAQPLAPHPTPLTPISPFTLDYSDDLDECADSFLLPPPLVRSFSSDSAASMREDDDDPCVTPPQYSCEELEEEAPVPPVEVEHGYIMTKRALSGMGSWLGLQLDGEGDSVFA